MTPLSCLADDEKDIIDILSSQIGKIILLFTVSEGECGPPNKEKRSFVDFHHLPKIILKHMTYSLKVLM